MKGVIIFFAFIFTAYCFVNNAQAQDISNVAGNIRSAKLYRPGDQATFPAIALNTNDQLQLVFDDLDNRVKNYYYTFQLCNADWSPSILHPFEYIKGFQNVRITTYRNSSIATARYINYQATIPDRNCYPSRSGNYLLRVYLDNDTSKTVFTKRFVIFGNTAVIAAQIQQPYNAQYFRSFQKLIIGLQMDNRVNVLSPSDIKVAILQNNNWQTALYINRPTINRGNYYEYSDEAVTAMPAGKEFRWVDLRSLRLLSDRVQKMEVTRDTQHVFIKPDPARTTHSYIYYRDINGAYTIESLDGVNPFWQGDYAQVHFRFAPPEGRPYEGSDVYLFGELTNYAQDTSAKLTFNKESGMYEKTLYLKQGYYNYAYVTKPFDGKGGLDFSQTEGDYWSTENAYTVLVYYRPFGSRADEVIGLTTLNSTFQRQGF